ncbi:YcaO-like family protein, partial [Streptomyces sp. SBT349]|uniref:YcaO-like family protein n=1 Tax=Streptomyces sp. SBT349 TaxID=1580539 RepID=UPI00066AF45D
MNTLDSRSPSTRSVPVLGGLLTLAWTPSDADGVSGGAADFSAEQARLRAAGEHAERRSLLDAKNALPLLPAAPAAPAAWDLAWMCPEHDGPVPEPAAWTTARGIVSGSRVAVPAECVLMGWDPPGRPATYCVQTSNGTAAGSTREAATAAALREILERDTLRTGWRTGRIRFEDLTPLASQVLGPATADVLERQGLQTRAVRVPGSRVEIVVAWLARADGTGATFGAAARPDTASAWRHAFGEAVAVRVALRNRSSGRRLQTCVRDRGMGAYHGSRRQAEFIAARTTEPGTLHTGARTLEELVAACHRRYGAEPAVIDLPPRHGLNAVRVLLPGTMLFPPRHLPSAPDPD